MYGPLAPTTMFFRRTWAVAHKELRHIGRSRLTLFMVTISPAMLLFLLSYVFAFNVNSADLAVMDLSQSQASRRYVAALTAGSDPLRLTASVASYETIDELLVAGAVDAAIVVPPDFDQAAAGQRATVQVIVDGSNTIIANQVIGMITRASALAGAGLQPALRQLAPTFELRSRAWYNDTLKSQISMVPGLMGIVLSLPALALSLSLTREKELGTLEGLMATPIQSSAYLLGKTSAYVLTGLGGLGLCWLVAFGWFKVPFRGDLPLLVGLTGAYFLATMGVSLLIASRVASQQTAILLVVLIFFVPSFFLAGLIDPIDRSSELAMALSQPLPATHYITIARGLFLKDVALEHLLQPTLMLLLMGAVALIVSSVLFKKKLG